jgi:hypothetical protein
MSPLLSTVRCWICDTSFQLDNRKIDEYGLPVHERCDATRVALEQATCAGGTKAKTPSSELVQGVKSFLNDASFAKVAYCSDCGAQMKHVSATFGYDGATWNIPLPFCPNCTGDVPQQKSILRRAS